MKPDVRALIAFAVSLVRSRVSLRLEILSLRHQFAASVVDPLDLFVGVDGAPDRRGIT